MLSYDDSCRSNSTLHDKLGDWIFSGEISMDESFHSVLHHSVAPTSNRVCSTVRCLNQDPTVRSRAHQHQTSNVFTGGEYAFRSCEAYESFLYEIRKSHRKILILLLADCSWLALTAYACRHSQWDCFTLNQLPKLGLRGWLRTVPHIRGAWRRNRKLRGAF